MINLGIIDNWDFSVEIEGFFVTVIASSPWDVNNGWYRAVIGMDGTFLSETRMLASGNYDPSPSTIRPSMKTMITKISADQSKAINALKVAFGIQ
jgi:hypothetical protein